MSKLLYLSILLSFLLIKSETTFGQIQNIRLEICEKICLIKSNEEKIIKGDIYL